MIYVVSIKIFLLMRLLLNKEYNKFLYLVCKNINILLNVIGIKCRYDTI